MNTGTRAVWTDAYHFDSKGDIGRYVDWCVKQNVTITFVGVNHFRGGMIYRSDVSPSLATSEHGTDYLRWDPFADTVRLSKAAGLEVHVWHCIANAGQPTLGTLEGLRVRDDCPAPLAESHPEWFCTDHTGVSCLDAAREDPKRISFVPLSLCREDARGYIRAMCLETADRYEIDGVHLDYIRFMFVPPGRTGREALNPNLAPAPENGIEGMLGNGAARFSFDGETTAAFQDETGVDFAGSGGDLASRVRWLYSDEDRLEQWYAWKASKVTTLVRELHEETKKRDLILSAAVFAGYPWCGREVAQRWPGWVDEKTIDLVTPMDYGMEPDAHEKLLIDQFSHLRAEPVPAVPFLTGISHSTFKGLDPGAAREKLTRYEEAAQRHGRSGVCMFNYGGFSKLL
jgi:uncharacterized lipoprotein YddW (UPF0748 family)